MSATIASCLCRPGNKTSFFVLFDHVREELKDVVCGNLAGAPRPNPVPEEAAWEDTSDEDE
ncbi:hypothetical protein VTN00DRAFT_3909 [Thermoascus crustaceus]|uniref:uncharacterized protein n=1 Tax=Thermoascus crustaceus TaxID=5088 RepID=UPI0037447D2F